MNLASAIKFITDRALVLSMPKAICLMQKHRQNDWH